MVITAKAAESMEKTVESDSKSGNFNNIDSDSWMANVKCYLLFMSECKNKK